MTTTTHTHAYGTPYFFATIHPAGHTIWTVCDDDGEVAQFRTREAATAFLATLGWQAPERETVDLRSDAVAPSRTLAEWQTVANATSTSLADRDELALRAFETDSCLFHAAHLIRMEGLASGRWGRSCSICGGIVTNAAWPDHTLCTIRVERGAPIERLDQVEPCPCAPCAKERGER